MSEVSEIRDLLELFVDSINSKLDKIESREAQQARNSMVVSGVHEELNCGLVSSSAGSGRKHKSIALGDIMLEMEW